MNMRSKNDNKNVSINNKTNMTLNQDIMKFTETINLDNAEDFCNLSYESYYKKFINEDRDTFNKNVSTSGDKWDEEEHMSYFNWIVKNLKDKIKYNQSSYEVEYKYGENCNNGRIYNKFFGIQSLPKKVKEYLLSDLDDYEFYDYDIVNAMPSILLYLSDTVNYKSKILKYYVKNRKKVLQKYNLQKLDVIIMMNCDNYKTNNEFLKALHTELKEMKPLINDKYQHLINIKFDNLKNLTSKITSRIVFYFENVILQKVMKKFIKNICVPYFDGFISRKELNEDELNEITKEYKYIKWINKPMNNEIELPIYTNTEEPFNISYLRKLCNSTKLNNLEEEYDICFDGLKQDTTEFNDMMKKYKNAYYEKLNEALDYFNKYVYVVNQNEVEYKTDVYNKKNLIEKTVNHKNYTHFSSYYDKFKIYKPNGKIKCITDIWRDYEFRREYYDVVFKPNVYYRYRHNESNILNLWRGWTYKYNPNHIVDEICLKNILYHLKNIICSGDEKCFNYLMRQWKVILMGKKTNIALGLTGSHGVGKNIITEYFGMKILGKKYYSYVSNIQDMIGQFTSMRSEKIFMVCDELEMWSGSKKESNKLKSIITSILCKKELKGRDAVNIEDYCNYCFLSNYKHFLRLEGNTDRRYFVLQVSDEKQKNRKYFNELNLDLGNYPKTRKITKKDVKHSYNVGYNFFHYIMNFDFGDDFELEDIPLTKQRKDMIKKSTPSIYIFYMWIINNIKKGCIEYNKIYTLKDLYLKFKKCQEELNYITNCKGKKYFSKLIDDIINKDYLGQYCWKTNKGRTRLYLDKKNIKEENIQKIIEKLERLYIFSDEVYELDYDDINIDDFIPHNPVKYDDF